MGLHPNAACPFSGQECFYLDMDEPGSSFIAAEHINIRCVAQRDYRRVPSCDIVPRLQKTDLHYLEMSYRVPSAFPHRRASSFSNVFPRHLKGCFLFSFNSSNIENTIVIVTFNQ